MTGRRIFAAALGAVALMTLAPVAGAATTQEIVRASDTLWAEATVDGPGSVVVTIKAPERDGEGREVWQRCRFVAVGPGTYRCGVDVAEGSLAAAREGVWVSKVSVEGTVTSKARFTL